MLDDGRYDAFIVWADVVGTDTAPARDAIDDARAGANDDGALCLSLTITAGAHKGDVLDVVARNFSARAPMDLVGLPCTLVVDGGEPRVEP